MIKKLMSVITLIHEEGLDTDGTESLIKQIPYWTEFLDCELGTLDYSAEVSFVKNLGYRVFRNSEGKHKLVYEDIKEL